MKCKLDAIFLICLHERNLGKTAHVMKIVEGALKIQLHLQNYLVSFLPFFHLVIFLIFIDPKLILSIFTKLPCILFLRISMNSYSNTVLQFLHCLYLYICHFIVLIKEVQANIFACIFLAPWFAGSRTGCLFDPGPRAVGQPSVVRWSWERCVRAGLLVCLRHSRAARGGLCASFLF